MAFLNTASVGSCRDGQKGMEVPFASFSVTCRDCCCIVSGYFSFEVQANDDETRSMMNAKLSRRQQSIFLGMQGRQIILESDELCMMSKPSVHEVRQAWHMAS